MTNEKVYLKLRGDYEDKEGYSSIQLCYQYKQKTQRLKTGVKCKPANWNKSKQIITSAKSEDQNSILLKLKSELNNLVTTYFITNKSYPTFQYVTENFINEPKEEEVKTNDFFLLFEKFISDKKELGQTDTAKIYNTLVKNLKDFAKKKKLKLNVNSFNQNVLNDFVIYLVKHKYSNLTMNLQAGTPQAIIQDITGHKSLTQFNKYVDKQQGRAEYINKVF